MPERAGALTGSLYKIKWKDAYINKHVRLEVEYIHNTAMVAFYNVLADSLEPYTGQTAASLRQMRDYLLAVGVDRDIHALQDSPNMERIRKTGYENKKRWLVYEKLDNLESAGVTSINSETDTTDNTVFYVKGNLQPGVSLRKQPFKFHFYFKSGSFAFNLYRAAAEKAKAAYKETLDNELGFFIHKENVASYMTRVRVDLEKDVVDYSDDPAFNE